MPGRGNLLWTGFGVLALVFLLSPLALVVFFSFAENQNATFPAGGATLHWYGVLFDDPDFWKALGNSAIVTLTVGLVSMVVGTAAAMTLARTRPALANALIGVITLPIMLPPLVLALALATGYSSLGLPLGLGTVIPSHVVFTQPFVILVVHAQMASFNMAVVDSARDLGAGPWTIFRTVILPIIRPTLIGATLMAMAVSLDDFIITYFTIGGGMTLPTMIWGMLRKALDPSINALGALVLVATVGTSLIALRLTRYRG
ncbi:ABC transporter permease [Zavarzinia compransoris]|uniref:ABC transporter permease n=1 Tax=Zavarzinia marina TaxID=2911065 RepID=UPI001F3E96E3|nr:ABC transporter permease [Zavarzinia marina]MCF4165330.1 ABC transporter permease [Zavarzinia marina]